MAATHEVLITTTDRVEAQTVLSMLVSQGIEARLSGTVDAARLGVGDSALPISVEVPVEDLARARELLVALPEVSADEPAVLGRKRALIALGVPVVWPGLAHVYAGRPVTGLVLGLAILPALLTPGGGVVWLVLLLADAVLGVRAVQAFNRGAPSASKARQLGVGLGVSVLAVLLAAGPELVKAIDRLRVQREFASYSLSCSPQRVAFTNTSSEPRTLELLHVTSVANDGSFERRFTATVPGRTVRLAAGERQEVLVEVPAASPCATVAQGGLVFKISGSMPDCGFELELRSQGLDTTVSCWPGERRHPTRLSYP